MKKTNNLQQEILDAQAAAFTKAIDDEIIVSLLESNGWKTVAIDVWRNYAEDEINNWCKKHLAGKTYNAASIWVFESDSDATAFALKWL